MNSKKPIINRKSKRVKKKALLSIYSILIIVFIGFSVSWLLSFRKTPIVSPIALGKVIDMSSRALIQASALLNKYDLHADSLTSLGSSVLSMKLSTGEEVFLSTTKDLDNQIHSLQLTLAHFTIVNKRITRFDDRFDKPVITFAQ